MVWSKKYYYIWIWEPPTDNILIGFEAMPINKKVINTSKSFKSINFDVSASSNSKIIQILSSDGKLIKRPFLVYREKKIILGFNEEEYSCNFE